MEELLIQQVGKCKIQQDQATNLELQVEELRMNLKNHIGNKVKVSFLPNQYYNDSIYFLENYTVSKEVSGLTINLHLIEGSIRKNYILEGLIHIDEQSFFNRIEYKAYCAKSEAYEEVYNFCLYF